MVAGPGGKARKSTLRNATARLLVLGDRQVGKSAAIVRFTTGRFIQNYSHTTNDWLYKQPLGYDSARNYFKQVELLEQRDVTTFQNTPSAQNVELDTDEDSERLNVQLRRRNNARNSLSCRVARDRQLDAELHERQQLLEKLRWANAFVVVYALNSSQSFNKAIRYLNLIANEVNNTSSNNQQVPLANKRPVLLLANKRDLDLSCGPTSGSGGGRTARRVSHSDGRLLAMRHQCLFAEVSVCESTRPIEQALNSLIEAIPPGDLHLTSHLIENDQPLNPIKQTQLTQWTPAELHRAPLHQIANQQQHHNSTGSQQPIWSSLVRTRAPQQAQSSALQQQTGYLAGKAIKRLSGNNNELSDTADWRTPTPVGARLSASSSTSSSSSASSSASSSSSSCSHKASNVATAISSSLVLPQAQVARPLSITRPSISSNSSISSTGGAVANKSQLGARYESLKSSFRKASLAIVGSRSLAARVASKPSQTTTSGRTSMRIAEESGARASDSDSSSATTINNNNSSRFFGSTSNLSQRPNWIRSKLGSLGKQEGASNSDTCGSIDNQSLHETPHHQSTTSRFRRPLFKYRNRRKTVAFEAVPAIEGSKLNSSTIESRESQFADNASLCQVSVSSESCSSMTTASNNDLTPRNKLTLTGNPLAECRNHSYNALCRPTGTSGANLSSSALCVATPTNTTDNGPTWHLGSQDVAQEPTAITVIKSSKQLDALTILDQANRRDSRSTLSRTSTSGGSCDEDSELGNCTFAKEQIQGQRFEVPPPQRAAKSIVTIETIQPLLEEVSVPHVYQAAYCKRLVAW